MLAHLRQIAEKSPDGRASLSLFQQETGWGRYWFDQHWPATGYRGACAEAGVQRGAVVGVERNPRLSDQEVAKRFAEAVQTLDGIPAKKRLTALTKTAEGTFCRGDSYSDAKRRLIEIYMGFPSENRLGDRVDEIMRSELLRLNRGEGRRPPTPAVAENQVALPRHAIRVPDEFIGAVRNSSDRGEEEKRQLVAQFFREVLGYTRTRVQSEDKHNDVRVYNRRKEPWLVVEVKSSLQNARDRRGARRQGFDYAHRGGMRFVVISDGDYYEVFDRCAGGRLRYDEMHQGSFSLTSLRARDADLLGLLATER